MRKVCKALAGVGWDLRCSSWPQVAASLTSAASASNARPMDIDSPASTDSDGLLGLLYDVASGRSEQPVGTFWPGPSTSKSAVLSETFTQPWRLSVVPAVGARYMPQRCWQDAALDDKI